MRLLLAWVLTTALCSCAVKVGPPSIVAAEPGNLHRLRYDERQLSRIEVEYPPEELRFSRTGDARVAFRFGSDGRVVEWKPDGSYTSDAFYQAAVKVLKQLSFTYIEGSWSAPINYFLANVAFRVPQCVPEPPSMNIDLQLTVCVSSRGEAKLAWESRSP